MTNILNDRPRTPLKPETDGVTPRRILLVENHPIVSKGLCALINDEEGLQVCGIAQDYDSALQKVEALQPDLIILEITLKGRGGLELLRDIKARWPAPRLLVLSMHDESVYAPRALRAGASGYVMKQEATEMILTAIRTVLDGNIFLSEPMEKKVLRRLVDGGTGPAFASRECLSDRELEVLRLIGQIKSTREIAAELHLSVKTIETHREHLKKKLNVKNGHHLLRRAIFMEQDAAGVADTRFAALSNVV